MCKTNPNPKTNFKSKPQEKKTLKRNKTKQNETKRNETKLCFVCKQKYKTCD